MVSAAETGIRETIRLTVPPGQHRARLDVYLTHKVENATRSKVQQGIDAGNVTVNGKAARSSYQVQPGDDIVVIIPGTPPPDVLPEAIPLDIVYEDDVLLVVNKPAGMVTHPAYNNYTGTLVNALLHHTSFLGGGGEALRPGIVHRLDKDTSGLLVVAKADSAHAYLSHQFARRTIEREYRAIVWGKMRSQSGTIDAALARSKRDRKKVAVMRDGKPATTEYAVQQTWRYLSMLQLHLLTGRTHQIRVHLAHIGHPVFGDPTYGGRTPTWGGLTGKRSQQAANLLKVMQRQALHARTIGFVHPVSKQPMRFESPLPVDMQELINRLEKETAATG